MFERRKSPLLPKRQYHVRLARHTLLGFAVLASCLGIGMVGYHFLENMAWIDSFANASMILSGMGPLGELHTNGGKIFAGCYALFSGLAFIIIMGIILSPVVHRFLHKFHVDESEHEKSSKKPAQD